MNRKRVGQVLAIIGAVLAVFGLHRLGDAKPLSAGDSWIGRLLLGVFDPMTAALVASYAPMILGALVGAIGLYVFLSQK